MCPKLFGIIKYFQNGSLNFQGFTVLECDRALNALISVDFAMTHNSVNQFSFNSLSAAWNKITCTGKPWANKIVPDQTGPRGAV